MTLQIRVISATLLSAQPSTTLGYFVASTIKNVTYKTPNSREGSSGSHHPSWSQQNVWTIPSFRDKSLTFSLHRVQISQDEIVGQIQFSIPPDLSEDEKIETLEGTGFSLQVGAKVLRSLKSNVGLKASRSEAGSSEEMVSNDEFSEHLFGFGDDKHVGVSQLLELLQDYENQPLSLGAYFRSTLQITDLPPIPTDQFLDILFANTLDALGIEPKSQIVVGLTKINKWMTICQHGLDTRDRSLVLATVDYWVDGLLHQPDQKYLEEFHARLQSVDQAWIQEFSDASGIEYLHQKIIELLGHLEFDSVTVQFITLVVKCFVCIMNELSGINLCNNQQIINSLMLCLYRPELPIDIKVSLLRIFIILGLLPAGNRQLFFALDYLRDTYELNDSTFFILEMMESDEATFLFRSLCVAFLNSLCTSPILYVRLELRERLESYNFSGMIQEMLSNVNEETSGPDVVFLQFEYEIYQYWELLDRKEKSVRERNYPGLNVPNPYRLASELLLRAGQHNMMPIMIQIIEELSLIISQDVEQFPLVCDFLKDLATLHSGPEEQALLNSTALTKSNLINLLYTNRQHRRHEGISSFLKKQLVEQNTLLRGLMLDPILHNPPTRTDPSETMSEIDNLLELHSKELQQSFPTSQRRRPRRRSSVSKTKRPQDIVVHKRKNKSDDDEMSRGLKLSSPKLFVTSNSEESIKIEEIQEVDEDVKVSFGLSGTSSDGSESTPTLTLPRPSAHDRVKELILKNDEFLHSGKISNRRHSNNKRMLVSSFVKSPEDPSLELLVETVQENLKKEEASTEHGDTALARIKKNYALDSPLTRRNGSDSCSTLEESSFEESSAGSFPKEINFLAKTPHSHMPGFHEISKQSLKNQSRIKAYSIMTQRSELLHQFEALFDEIKFCNNLTGRKSKLITRSDPTDGSATFEDNSKIVKPSRKQKKVSSPSRSRFAAKKESFRLLSLEEMTALKEELLNEIGCAYEEASFIPMSQTLPSSPSSLSSPSSPSTSVPSSPLPLPIQIPTDDTLRSPDIKLSARTSSQKLKLDKTHKGKDEAPISPKKSNRNSRRLDTVDLTEPPSDSLSVSKRSRRTTIDEDPKRQKRRSLSLNPDSKKSNRSSRSYSKPVPRIVESNFPVPEIDYVSFDPRPHLTKSLRIAEIKSPRRTRTELAEPELRESQMPTIKFDVVSRATVHNTLFGGSGAAHGIIIDYSRLKNFERPKQAPSLNSREYSLLHPLSVTVITNYLQSKRSPKGLCEAILKLQLDELSSSCLKRFLCWFPSPYELEAIKSYQVKKEFQEFLPPQQDELISAPVLDTASKFVLDLIKVPNLWVRFKYLKFVYRYMARTTKMKLGLQATNRAIKYLNNCQNFKIIFEFLLKTGLELSGGHWWLSSAKGFRISSLSVLSTMQGQDQNSEPITLLDHVVGVLLEKHPEVLTFKDSSDLNVTSACSFDLFFDEITKMSRSFDKILALVAGVSEDEILHSQINPDGQLDKIGSELPQLRSQIEHLQQNFQNLVRFYGEDVEHTTICDFFGHFTCFIASIQLSKSYLETQRSLSNLKWRHFNPEQSKYRILQENPTSVSDFFQRLQSHVSTLSLPKEIKDKDKEKDKSAKKIFKF